MKLQQLSVLRIAAILLTVLTVVCLFWPPMISAKQGELRDEMEGSLDDIESLLKEMKKTKDEQADLYQKKYEMSAADAKRYANAQIDNFRLSNRTDHSVLSLRSMLVNLTTLDGIEGEYEIPDEYGMFDNVIHGNDEDYDNQRNMAIIFSIVTNILFFGTLAFGLAAIVLMLLTRTPAASIALAVMAVLCSVSSLILLIYMNGKINELPFLVEMYESPCAPGVGLFLMPVFAIAACVLLILANKKPAAVRTAAPAYRGYAPEPTYNGWGAPAREPERSAAPAWGTPAREPERSAAPAWGAPARDPERSAAPAWSAPAREPERPAAPAWSAPAREPERPAAPAPQRPIFGRGLQRPSTSGWDAPAREPERPATPAREPERPAAPAPQPTAEAEWICPNCEAKNEANENVCGFCGSARPAMRTAAAKPVFCPRCGTQLDASAAFCTKCGQRVR